MTGDWRDQIAAYLTPEVRGALFLARAEEAGRATELRLISGRPPLLCGRMARALCDAPVSQPDIERMAGAMLGHAAHARQEELRQGFVTLPGGFRAGLCGRAAVKDGRLSALQEIGSIVVRIAREVRGAALPLLPAVLQGDMPRSALIVSPPGFGKTTILRDLARLLSERGFPVAIVDERSEIAACDKGAPTMDVGPVTHVLDGCPKAEGIRLALRAVAPRVIITDELGDAADAAAVLEAARCGVAVIASAHARDARDAMDRPALRELVLSGAMETVIPLTALGVPGETERMSKVGTAGLGMTQNTRRAVL